MAPRIKDKRHLVGIILVLIGAVLILDNIRFIPHFIPWWIWTWQFLLITIGVFSLLTSEKTGPGIILIGIGTVFLLSNVLPDRWPHFFNWFDGSVFWYLVIIIIGLSLILRKRIERDPGPSRRRSRRPGKSGRPDFARTQDGDDTTVNIDGDASDYLDEIAVFAGGKKIITSSNFQGGNVTSIFGGSDIDLTQSQLAPGVVEIEVFAMFGGWTLVVPQHWQVKSDVVAIFGGVSDKRVLHADAVKDNTRHLVIKGFVMFGGGEIKSY